MTSTANLLSLFMLVWVKSSIVVATGFVMLSLRWTARIGDRALWMMVFASIAALPVLNAVLPSWDRPLVAVHHGLVQNSLPLGAGHISFIEGIAILWAAGVLISLASLLLDHLRARRLIDRGEHASDERVLGLLARARLAVGYPASPRIVLTESLATPALVGLSRPVLLLPADSCAWEDDELFAVICHELHHLEKRDLITNLLERVVAALLWVNPLVHAARRYSAFAREVAADRAALGAGVPPERLARWMIAIARTGQADRAWAVALTFASVEGTRFERRIKALFTAESRLTRRSASSFVPMAWFALTVVSVAIAEVLRCVPEI